MAPVVPLDPLQIQLLDTLAGQLRSPPLGWPVGVRASALRISMAMDARQAPDAEDLCRVLFVLLDADRVSGYLEDQKTRSSRPIRPEVQAVHARFGISSPPGSIEVLDGATVYFLPT